MPDQASYACVLHEIGFADAMARFCEVVLTPLAEVLFPRQGRNMGDDYRAYVTKTAAGEDIAVQKHMDMSDVTMNVCLGKQFTGGATYFEGVFYLSAGTVFAVLLTLLRVRQGGNGW